MSNVTEKSELVCTINLDGKEEVKSTDFVAVIAKEDCDASMYLSTDVVTLAMAIRLLTGEFIEGLAECEEEDREIIFDILGKDELMNAVNEALNS